MRSRVMLITAALAFALTGAANAEDLLWDNYPGGIDSLPQGGGAIGAINMSSERNTQIVEPTWVVDDVEVSGGTGAGQSGEYLTRLTWVGARDDGHTYDTADVLFLDDNMDTILELTDVNYTVTQERDYLDPYARLYEAEVAFDQTINLATLGDHFFVGVRLVGSETFDGRNHFVTSSVDSTLYGETEGYIKALSFGAPDWTPASDVWYSQPTPDINFEFAFKLYSDVPEPASLGLIVIGGLLFVRRR